MSTYTTELRYICETVAGLDESVGYNDTDAIIKAAAPKIFNFDFPIFDPFYKIPLCEKIIEHYYTREIGEETYGLWRLRLRARMREIMPYYNQLYKSAQLTFDPLTDTDVTTTHKLTRAESSDAQTSGTSSGTSAGSGKTTNAETSKREQDYSDTPQGDSIGVLDKKYLTNVTIENNTGSTSGTQETESETSGTSSGTEKRSADSVDDYLERVTGKRGGQSYSTLITEFRETLINIDNMIIDELADLFINLW